MDNDNTDNSKPAQEKEENTTSAERKQTGSSEAPAEYSGIFANYADWLESNKYAQKTLYILRRHTLAVVFITILVIALVPFVANLMSSSEEGAVYLQIKSLADEVKSMKQTSERLEQEVSLLRDQLATKERSTQKYWRLSEMTIAGQQEAVEEGQTFSVDSPEVKLERLRFVDHESGRAIYAVDIKKCRYRIDDGEFLNTRGRGGVILLRLEKQAGKYAVFLKEIHFQEITGASHVGAGYFFLQLGEH